MVWHARDPIYSAERYIVNADAPAGLGTVSDWTGILSKYLVHTCRETLTEGGKSLRVSSYEGK